MNLFLLFHLVWLLLLLSYLLFYCKQLKMIVENSEKKEKCRHFFMGQNGSKKNLTENPVDEGRKQSF